MTAPSPTATPPRGRLELWAGLGLVGLLGLTLALGALDVARNQAELRPLAGGDAAPDFTLPTPDGKASHSLASFRGKVVLLDFWATWCPPCIREMPELAALHGELKDRGFTVLGVNREPEDTQKVQQFLAQRGIPFPVVVDTQGVGERYKVMSLPTTVLIDREGRVVHQFMGYTEPARLKDAVLKVLGGS